MQCDIESLWGPQHLFLVQFIFRSLFLDWTAGMVEWWSVTERLSSNSWLDTTCECQSLQTDEKCEIMTLSGGEWTHMETKQKSFFLKLFVSVWSISLLMQFCVLFCNFKSFCYCFCTFVIILRAWKRRLDFKFFLKMFHVSSKSFFSFKSPRYLSTSGGVPRRWSLIYIIHKQNLM